jgi:hypothetical protein
MNFKAADWNLSIQEAWRTFLNLFEDHSDWSGDNTFVLTRALHCISFAWPRLTVGENTSIKPIQSTLNNLRDLFKNFFLSIDIGEYAIIFKLFDFLLIIFDICNYSN